MGDWDGVRLFGGGAAAQVRERLAAGADPCAVDYLGQPMLHKAAECASPEVVEAMATAARDIDVLAQGRSALWLAVHARRLDIPRVLVAAGADPWLPMMAGWSPGRLSLAGPEPDLFPDRPDGVSLTQAESQAVALGRQLQAALADIHLEGAGLLCVAGIDAAEAVRRLDGTPMTREQLLTHYGIEDDKIPALDAADADEPWRYELDLQLVGITDVPGGCVVTQPWGYQPQTQDVGNALSAGTIAYGLYANPKSGDQGRIFTDGRLADSGLSPGGYLREHATADEVLHSYLYRHRAAAYACAYVGLGLSSARPVTGPPDTWVLLPERGYPPG